jgi:hypothetical protein
MEYFWGAVLSLLPRAWRPWWDAEPVDAIFSGLIQLLTGSLLFLYRYIDYSHAAVVTIPQHVLLGAAEARGETAIMSYGLVVSAQYLTEPITLLLLWLAWEGAVRSAEGYVNGEVLPSLPLFVAEKLRKALAGDVKSEHVLANPASKF